MNRLMLLSAVALVVACGQAMGQNSEPPPAKERPAAKEPAADKKVDRARLAEGEPAPAMEIEKWVKGGEVKFEPGKVYVVEFWATWCAPCRAAMPHLTELQKSHKDKGLTVIGVASPGLRDKIEDVEKMVAEKGEVMGYTIAWDRAGATVNNYMKAARLRGIPASFVIDQKGNVAWYGTPSELDYVLDDVLAGTWDYKTGPAKLKKMGEERQAIFAEADSDPQGSLKLLAAFEAKYPKSAKDMLPVKYELQMLAGDYDAAYKTGATLVDHAIAQKDAQTLNTIAWNIVDPDGDVKKKDVDFAMRAAKEAVRISEEKDGAILDTLARCYWLKGDKVKAIELQKKAIAALSKDPQQEDMKAQLEATLKEYEGGSN